MYRSASGLRLGGPRFGVRDSPQDPIQVSALQTVRSTPQEIVLAPQGRLPKVPWGWGPTSDERCPGLSVPISVRGTQAGFQHRDHDSIRVSVRVLFCNQQMATSRGGEGYRRVGEYRRVAKDRGIHQVPTCKYLTASSLGCT